jgi:FkbM family methyltransferase
MKIKNIVNKLGIKQKTKRYGYATQQFEYHGLPVYYSQWLHPKETPKKMVEKEIDELAKYICPGDFCIDIGAHTGDSTLPIALAAGKEGCVLALEPNPYLYHVLEKNVRSNRSTTHIIPLMAAAIEQEGFVTFEYSDSGFCNGGNHKDISFWEHGHAFDLEVFGVNLQHELNTDFKDLLPRLRFIKIDAEGFDLFIIRSILEVIKTYHPVIKAEVFKRTSQAYRDALYDQLSELDYSIYKIDEEPVKKGLLLKKGDMMNWKHFDILCV